MTPRLPNWTAAPPCVRDETVAVYVDDLRVSKGSAYEKFWNELMTKLDPLTDLSPSQHGFVQYGPPKPCNKMQIVKEYCSDCAFVNQADTSDPEFSQNEARRFCQGARSIDKAREFAQLCDRSWRAESDEAKALATKWKLMS